jgi:chromosome segregation ATPase
MVTLKKIVSISIIILCAIFLIVLVSGIIGSWILNRNLKQAAVEIITIGETVTASVQNGVQRVSVRVENLNNITTDIGESLNKASESISDKGLVMTLLPDEKEQALISTGQEFQNTLSELQAVFINAKNLYSSIDQLPFISLPEPDEDRLQKILDRQQNLQKAIQNVQSKIQEIRTKTSGTIDNINEPINNINQALSNTTNDLNRIDSDLARIQNALSKIKANVGLIFNLITLVIDLILLWLACSQIFAALWAWKQFISLKSSSATNQVPDLQTDEK